MEFWKLGEPKATKCKEGYSSNDSLVFQSGVKDIWVYVLEHHLSQWEAIQLVKDFTSKHAWLKVEYYLGLTPKRKHFFQGLIDHLQPHISILWDCQFPDSGILQPRDQWYVSGWAAVAGSKIGAHKPEFLGEANQSIKHQFAQNLRDPYFGVVARGQFLSSPASESFTQFWGQLAFMFNSRGKCTKVVMQHLWPCKMRNRTTAVPQLLEEAEQDQCPGHWNYHSEGQIEQGIAKEQKN